jgi:hypothetical protein
MSTLSCSMSFLAFSRATAGVASEPSLMRVTSCPSIVQVRSPVFSPKALSACSMPRNPS